MIVRMIAAPEFYGYFPCSRNAFGERAFIELNSHKAQAVCFFAGFADDGEEPLLGIVLGYRNGAWLAPFSAPFTELYYQHAQTPETIYDFVSELSDMLEDSHISIQLPSTFYDPVMLTRADAVLTNYAHKVYADYNYHYDLGQFPEFKSHLSPSARNHYNRALREGFECTITQDLARAYAVIEANRTHKGYPLRMTLQDVEATIQPAGPIQADLFVLSQGDADVAAAICYRVTNDIAQVIYWGDVPGYSASRPMNLLPYYVFEHYYKLGFRIVDIGTASQRGVPQTGLCRFKEAVGCTLALKPGFEL